jgi:SOS-response transcriptional repressor LexA
VTEGPGIEQKIITFPRRDPLHLFILETFATAGRAPSLDEIQFRFGLATLVEANEQIEALERTGAIHRNPGERASGEQLSLKQALARGRQVFEHVMV